MTIFLVQRSRSIKSIVDVAKAVLCLLLIVTLTSCAGFSGLSGQGGASGPVDSTAVTGLLKKAQSSEQDGKVEEARKFYEEMMAAGARSASALNHYAVFLRKQLDIDLAEQVYQQALQGSPRDAATHYNLAILYELYRGDFKLAKKHYQSYQKYSEAADPLVKGWIADLDRRLASQNSQAKSGAVQAAGG